MLTAAMMMAQAQMICNAGNKPLLLLDDIASELDEVHLKKVLAAALELKVQIWLTGTNLAPEISKYKGSKAVFHVKHGEVLPVPEKTE